MSSLQLRNMLGRHLELQPDKAILWDRRYYCVKHSDWGRIFSDVLLNMPKYTKDKFDCENFALLVSARVAEKYKLNACGIAIGDSPWGYHGFNIFLSDVGLFYLEPQNGDVFPVGEVSGYKADLVIFG
ncbi:unnamed protein product [marine sediment metagenome]|uniref:Uncharacterized protein n=1 Tax=marine sediment metagenome TaxID=412755 RepID=X1I1J1_9ZZZZ